MSNSAAPLGALSSLHTPQRVRVVIENWTIAGVERVEGPWRTVPPGMAPEKVNELLFRGALGDFDGKPHEPPKPA